MTVSGLPEQARRALSRPELAPLWQQARKQLERYAGEPRGAVTIAVPDQRTASELGAVLGRSLTKNVGGSTRVDLAALDQRLRNGAAQCSLADTVAAVTGKSLLQRQAELAVRTRENQAAVAALLTRMSGIPELRAERVLLAAAPVGPVARPPAGSSARTTSWSVYDDAVRAASLWWEAQREGRRLAAKELAGQAFRDTKKWNDQRRFAFSYLVAQPFDQALDQADIPIRLSGPLTWVSADTIADAAATYPWIAVPLEG
jgi:hypothetical protein